MVVDKQPCLDREVCFYGVRLQNRTIWAVVEAIYEYIKRGSDNIKSIKSIELLTFC